MSRILLLALCAVLPAFATPARAQNDTIKIGEFASLTGKEAAFGRSSHRGTVLAVEEINAAGGVLGRRLELVTEDNQSKPGESATAVKKLIARDKVVAVLGEVSSFRSLEAAAVCQAQKIPMIVPSATNPRITETGDYIFRVCYTDSFQGTALAKFALNTLKARRVAILISVSNAFSVGLTRYFKERFLPDGGEVAAEQKYNEGDRDFRAQLTAIKAARPDAIFASGYYTEAALICIQARQLGLNVPVFGGDGWASPALIELGGKAVEGAYYSNNYATDAPAPEVQDFVRHYRARWDGEMPDGMTAFGHDSVLVLADAIRRAGGTEPDKIRAALATTKDVPGATGRTTINAQRNADKAIVILTVRDGRLKFVERVEP
jgi:branched-chain amino acid transport system substrate-binding protein